MNLIEKNDLVDQNQNGTTEHSPVSNRPRIRISRERAKQLSDETLNRYQQWYESGCPPFTYKEI